MSRSRIHEGQNFSETAELDFVKLGTLGINVSIPVIDRYSPLVYSIRQHIHWVIAKHKRVETSN